MYPEVLIINGSARKGKNCFKLSNLIEQKLKQNNITSKVFNIYDMNIEYCTACGFCDKKGYCKYNDDMKPMYTQFDKAKGVIVISPVCFNSVSAKIKTVVDRTQAIYASKYILNNSLIDRSKKRIGMYIAVGGSNSYEDQFKGGDIVMEFFFKSINNKLLYNLRLNNTDKVSFEENIEFQKKLYNNIDEYIKNIKELD